MRAGNDGKPRFLANHAGGIAYLQFSNKPDGRLEARYQLMGLMEGLVTPSFLKDHFQLNDFTPFHDEIRQVSADFMVGTYMTALPAAVSGLLGTSSLGSAAWAASSISRSGRSRSRPPMHRR